VNKTQKLLDPTSICWPLYAQEETQSALELPETWEPQAMIFLGWADEEPKEKVLRPTSGLVQYIEKRKKT
jgi:hypothetical protein